MKTENNDTSGVTDSLLHFTLFTSQRVLDLRN